MVVEVEGDLSAAGMGGDLEVLPDGEHCCGHGVGSWCSVAPIPGTFRRTQGFGGAVDPLYGPRPRTWILSIMRIDFDPAAMSRNEFYRLLTATVVPRPIAWVSTTSADGTHNLAPHSFFTIASVAPPVVQFTSVGRKDTLRNVEATGQFVVNLAPEGSSSRSMTRVRTFRTG